MDKKKVKNKKPISEIGIGYIPEACRAVGVSGTVYYTAKKKLERNERLTKAEIAVMAKHNELIEEAQKKLESIKSNKP